MNDPPGSGYGQTAGEKTMRIIVTGAGGFVGSALVARLAGERRLSDGGPRITETVAVDTALN